MVLFAIYLTIVGAAVGGFAVFSVVSLARAFGGRTWPLLGAGLLLIAGTVPPTVLAVLWYARTADYRWAISGPGAFAQVGGGPAMLAALTVTCAWTAATWISALRLSRRLIHEIGRVPSDLR